MTAPAGTTAPPSPPSTAATSHSGILEDSRSDTADTAISSDRTRVMAGVDALEKFDATQVSARQQLEGGVQADEEEAKEAKTNEPPRGLRLYLLMAALLLVEFLVGIDNTIVATSTATIANEFNALTDVGWYGSAYLLTSVSFQPLFGRAYQFFNQKYVFLLATVLFLLGEVVAAVATSSPILILGRALQGTGYAGQFIGVLAISANSLPVRMQAVVTSLMNLAYGLGTVLGPLIGGAFTEKLSWRWCFWIGDILGAPALVLIMLFCNPPKIPQTLSIKARIIDMDFAGAFLLLGSLVCLLIALQEGGITTPWSDPKMIGLLCGFGLILAAFFALQSWLGEKSSISMRLLQDRSMVCLTVLNWTCGASYYAILYFFPLYFQAVRGWSPVTAGINMLPLIAFNMFMGIVAGWVVKRWGTFHPPLAVGTGLTALGAGLLATLTSTTPTWQWALFGSIVGAGMGTLYMMSFVASQVLLDESDRPKGASLVCFSQIFGATIWVSASSALYANRFKAGISTIEGVDVQAVLDSGVDRFREVVAPEQLDAVVQVAQDALWHVFLAIALIGAIGFVCILGIRYVSLGREGEEVEKEKLQEKETTTMVAS